MISKFAPFVLVLACAWIQIRFAEHKFFTPDEAFQEIHSCPFSYGDMLVRGAGGQCSPPPLYYMVQKTYLALIPTDERMLISFRMVSILSGAATLAFFFGSLFRWFGWSTALFGGLLLISQPIFHEFSAESRPYLFWVLIFTVFSVFWVKVVLQKGDRPRDLWALGLASAALTFVSSAGMLQAVGGLATLAVLRSVRLRVLLPLCLGLGAVGFYYSLHSCPPVPGPWNLLETRNPDLILFSLRLLLPSGGLYTWLLNAVVCIGLIAPLSSLRKGRKDQLTVGQAISLLMGLQLLVTVVIGISVAIRGYFFVPRVFIYLVICRALLGAVGIHFILTRVRWSWAYRAAGIVSVLLIALKLQGLHSFLQNSNPPDPRLAQVGTHPDCEKLVRPLEFWIPAGITAEDSANAFVRVAHLRAICFSKHKPLADPGRLLLNKPGASGDYAFIKTPPENATRYAVCGREVSLSDR